MRFRYLETVLDFTFFNKTNSTNTRWWATNSWVDHIGCTGMAWL